MENELVSKLLSILLQIVPDGAAARTKLKIGDRVLSVSILETNLGVWRFGSIFLCGNIQGLRFQQSEHSKREGILFK